MKPAVRLWLVLILGFTAEAFAGQPAASFAVQLIRGTDQEKPQETGWKPIEPTLRAQFRPVFRWKHYWEVNRTKATLLPGKSARVRLSNQREVEIELLNTKEAEVRLYVDGHLTRKSRQRVREGCWIMGGSRDNGGSAESWFVVVKPEKRDALLQALRE